MTTLEPTLNIICGDALTVLRLLPSESVQCCVTSPPYFGLRDYGIPGQLGLEGNLDEYLDMLVSVFAEVKRVLKNDGTLWLNLGDSYASGKPKNTRVQDLMWSNEQSVIRVDTLKPKDLIGIPWMVAFALRTNGWILRADIIWAKPNPMPESIVDRPTKAHEYVFLLSKSERYFYDAEAIKEPASFETTKMPDGWDTQSGGHGAYHRNGREKGAKTDKQRGHFRRHAGFNERWDAMEKAEQCSGMRNKRDVWTVATHPFPEAHFATYPPNLIKPCVLAGSRELDTVLDPFSGAATTGVVCKSLRRSYLGIELNPEYVEMSWRRLTNTQAPLDLEFSQ